RILLYKLKLQSCTLIGKRSTKNTIGHRSMAFQKLFFSIFLFLFTGWIAAAPAAEQPNSKPYVLVSVAPHKFFVEKIANDTLKVELMVPAGASSHTFEPSPRQMLNAGNAEIWFQIGESFEPKASAALKAHHPNMQLVDLRQGVDLIYDTDCK